MKKNSARQNVVFTLIPCKFEGERTIRGSLSVLFAALVSRLSFLAPVAIQYIHAITVWVQAFSSLADHFYILGTEHFLNFVSYLKHIHEMQIVEHRHVDVDSSLAVTVFVIIKILI
mgnify:CR=1 FL=1|jgi:hypothetical protein